jgi:hypothetical protein
MPFDRSASPLSFAPILAATLCMAAAQIATADGTRVSDTEPPAQAMREDPALAADLAILARFDVPFAEPKSFRDATARQVIDEAAKAAGLAVEIDSQIVGESGGWELIQLSCDARTPREALDAVAQAISTSYRRMELEVVAGIPVFSEYSRATRLVALRRYDLQPIFARMAADRSEDADDDARTATITDILTEGVDPEGWVDLGGNISRLRVIGRTLIVWTTPSRHHALASLLRELEHALPALNQVWRIRVAIVSPGVDAGALETALGSQAGLDALLEADGASLVAAPRLLALRGQEASITVEGGEDAVEVRITPTVSRDASLVKVLRRTGERTMAVTLRAVERVRGAGVVVVGDETLLVEVLCEDAAEAPDAADQGKGASAASLVETQQKARSE